MYDRAVQWPKRKGKRTIAVEPCLCEYDWDGWFSNDCMNVGLVIGVTNQYIL